MKKKNNEILQIPVIIAASLLIAININTFINAGGLYPGGISGITILLQRIFLSFLHVEIPYTVVNLLLNAFPVYIGFRYIGRRFTINSLLVIILSSIFTDIIPPFSITYDTFLVCVFGGIIGAFSTSLCLGMNASTGGTDFIAMYFFEKKGVDSWNLIFCLNILILGIAGFLFGWDKALYSIIYQFTVTEGLKLFYKKYQQETLFIVTNKPREICTLIYELSGHGATVLEGEGAHDYKERYMVYSVISANDCKKLLKVIRETDPDSFVNQIHTERLRGHFYIEKND